MSEFEDIDDKVPTTVRQDLVQLDAVFDSTNLVRETVIKKLGSVVETMNISTSEAKLLEAQMGVINTYLSVLNGKEANVSRRVASKLKQLETETSSKHSQAVADLLSKLSTKGSFSIGNPSNILDQTNMDQQIEEAFASSGLDPILTTELKTDPKDLRD